MSASDGFVGTTTKIVDHGPDSDRWNLVIIGDGYRESELEKYHAAVQNFVSTLGSTPPFDELFGGINIYQIDVVSDESGADDPNAAPEVTVNTFFDAKFWPPPLERVLTIDAELAQSVTSERVPERHQVLCIVNVSNYGGSGVVLGGLATCSTHSASALIAIHEMGHSAFGLADEYGGAAVHTEEPVNPNVTLDANRDTNKWNAFILDTTPMPTQCNSFCVLSTCEPPNTPAPAGAVGAYEGGAGSSCNIYRPVFQCKMAANSAPFCPVCSGVIRATLEPFLPPQ